MMPSAMTPLAILSRWLPPLVIVIERIGHLLPPRPTDRFLMTDR
jgi:hypothetical protein